MIDAGDFRKLEQIGPFKIIRPSPQSVWPAKDFPPVDAEYHRFSGGDGEWKFRNPQFKSGAVVRIENLQFKLKPTDFGHLGIFAEQAATWRLLQDWVSKIKQTQGACKVLNLFAYTGGSTLACAKAGAEVVHIDASKTSVAWARENAELNQLGDAPVRWIVEDVKKFVQREIKRGSVYHGIILDPPSYGRGNKAEIWKIETDLAPLMNDLAQILDRTSAFVALSSHSQGYTPLALDNILERTLGRQASQKWVQEMLTEGAKIAIPSGAIAAHLYL